MNIIDAKCKNCGGELNISSRFSKTVVCRYCNTVYLLENNAINNIGVTKPFEPLSIFRVGATGKIDGKTLNVLGRIRLTDEDDVWDEWYILLDNQPFWIEESSDTLLLLSSFTLTHPIAPYDDVNVGQTINIEDNNVFISEKGQAKVEGIEGEFSGRVKPNNDYKYIQGGSTEGIWMVEYYPNDIKLYTGQQINFNTISIE